MVGYCPRGSEGTDADRRRPDFITATLTGEGGGGGASGAADRTAYLGLGAKTQL